MTPTEFHILTQQLSLFGKVDLNDKIELRLVGFPNNFRVLFVEKGDTLPFEEISFLSGSYFSETVDGFYSRLKRRKKKSRRLGMKEMFWQLRKIHNNTYMRKQMRSGKIYNYFTRKKEKINKQDIICLTWRSI